MMSSSTTCANPLVGQLGAQVTPRRKETRQMAASKLLTADVAREHAVVSRYFLVHPLVPDVPEVEVVETEAAEIAEHLQRDLEHSRLHLENSIGAGAIMKVAPRYT